MKPTIKKLLSFKTESKINNVKNDPNGRMIFVHIPKTAGSSFRTSFESKYVTYKDYGNGSKNTSKEVQVNIHEIKDFYSFKTIFSQHQDAWITGHVHLAKYINFVPVTNTISFVRKPLEQVISHYNHYVKHHGFKEDISTFFDKSYAKNLQSKCLGIMPISLIGCLGITEYYDESLVLINAQFGFNLPLKKINVNNTKALTVDLLDKKLKQKFIKNNKNDMVMYREAKFLHAQRVSLSKENKAWTYGSVAIHRNNILKGCAFQYKNDEPVSIVIKINERPFMTAIAKDFYSALGKVNFPRERYVGFSIHLPKNITNADIIDVFVEETGQKLNFKPLKVQKLKKITEVSKSLNN
jgi:hypothetical protein